MFQVICYAVHEKEIASIDVFSSEEEAYEFIEEDSQNVYNEEVAGGSGKDQISYVLDYPCASVSSYGGEYEWTWELKEIQDPVQKQLNKYAREKTNEMKTVELADGAILKGPSILELSNVNIGWLDELEYDVWDLFCTYCERLGITVEDESNPDWSTVKAIQEFVFKQIEDAGILLNFAGVNERFYKQLMEFQTSTEDTKYILQEVFPISNSMKWEKLIVSDKIGRIPEEQRHSLCYLGIVLHAALPSGKALLLYNFSDQDNGETLFLEAARQSQLLGN